MLGKTHLAAGICIGAGYAAAAALPAAETVLAVLAAAFGSLVPDLDHRKSKLTRESGTFGAVSSRVFRHRGMLHAPALYLVVSAVLYYAFSADAFLRVGIAGVLAGELSHIFLDLLNPSGVPLFWPLTRRRISLLPLQTGGWMDRVLGVLSLAAALWFLLQRFF